uniref:Glycolipid transfer protein n=1 Tax=Gallus gallus TaxID=9031 RepID=A0A8V0Z9Y5_CHICK
RAAGSVPGRCGPGRAGHGAAAGARVPAAAGRQADRDAALPGGRGAPAALLRLPGDAHRILTRQSRPGREHQENPGRLRLQPQQVQNAAEHPGGGEGDARRCLAQDGRYAGADVAEEVTMGLKFMLVLLQSISDGERDEEHPNLIRVNAMKAYEIALKKYHGWMLQKLFMGSVYALPYKSDLLKALEKGREVKEEESIEKIHQFLARVTPILDAIYEMYTRMNAELSYKA